MTKTLKAFFVTSILIPPWALFLLCCYWYFIDIEPPAKHTEVFIKDANGEISTKVRRGDKVFIGRQSCVTEDGRAFYSRWLVAADKSRAYMMPSGDVELLRGCYLRYNETLIPASVQPGSYDYIVTVVFQNNPLVETRMVLPIPRIEVTP